MNKKKVAMFLLVSLISAAFSFNIGCSKDKSEEQSLLGKVKKIDRAMGKKDPKKSAEDPLREKHMVVIERCSEKFGACLDECAQGKNVDNCDAKCQDTLALCEKELPDYLRTMK